MLGKQLSQTRVVREDIHGPRLDLRQHTLVEVLDLKRHAAMLANSLTTGKLAAREVHTLTTAPH